MFDSLSDRQKVALSGACLAAPFGVASIVFGLYGTSLTLSIMNPVLWLWIYLLFQAPFGLWLMARAALTSTGKDPLRRRSYYQPPLDD
jgi:multisubunit Na+/H+ antiporter MnhG subunit